MKGREVFEATLRHARQREGVEEEFAGAIVVHTSDCHGEAKAGRVY